MRAFKSVREFADITRDAVLAGAWDQRIGTFEGRHPERACCVGAKVARVLAEPSGPTLQRQLWRHAPWLRNWSFPWEFDYRDGIAAACKMLACTEQDLARLLQACGARVNPFGCRPWEVERAVVWDRLGLIEAMPNFNRRATAHRGAYLGPLRALAFVREANHAHWRRCYGVDERELPHWTVNGFWTAFAKAIEPVGKLELDPGNVAAHSAAEPARTGSRAPERGLGSQEPFASLLSLETPEVQPMPQTRTGGRP